MFLDWMVFGAFGFDESVVLPGGRGDACSALQTERQHMAAVDARTVISDFLETCMAVSSSDLVSLRGDRFPLPC